MSVEELQAAIAQLPAEELDRFSHWFEEFITDGPFLETKEHIGGFWILEAADMDEALA